MTARFGSRGRLGALAALSLGASLLAGASPAEAGCLRHVYNRSPYVLVATQDGGPPVVVMPGRALPVRMSRPGSIAVSAYCGVPGFGSTGGAVLERTFDYEAQIDRCFIRFGSDYFFAPQLGRGFMGGNETKPFTVNNPQQGDIALSAYGLEPYESACPVLRRGG